MPLIRAVKGRTVCVRGGLSARGDLVSLSNYSTANAVGYFWDVPNLLSAPNYNATLSCAEFRDSSLIFIPVSTTPSTFPYYNLDNLFAGYWPPLTSPNGGTPDAMTFTQSLSNDITYFLVYRFPPGLSANNQARPPGTVGLRTTGYPAILGAVNYATNPSNINSYWHEEDTDINVAGGVGPGQGSNYGFHHPSTNLVLLSTTQNPIGPPSSNTQITNANIVQNVVGTGTNVNVIPSDPSKFVVFAFRRSRGTLYYRMIAQNLSLTNGPILTGSTTGQYFDSSLNYQISVLPFSLNVDGAQGSAVQPNRGLFGLNFGSFSPAGIGLYGLSAITWSYPTFDFPGLFITVNHAPTATATGDGRPGATISVTNPRVNQYNQLLSQGSVTFTNIPGGWSTPNINFTVECTSGPYAGQKQSGSPFTVSLPTTDKGGTTYIYQVYDNRTSIPPLGLDGNLYRQQLTYTSGNDGSTQTARLEPRNVPVNTAGYGSIFFSQVGGRFNSGQALGGQDIDRTGGTAPNFGVLSYYNSDSYNLLVQNYIGSDSSLGWQFYTGANICPVLSTNASAFVMVALSSKKLWDDISGRSNRFSGTIALYKGARDPSSSWGVSDPVNQYPYRMPTTYWPNLTISQLTQYMVPWGEFVGTGIPFCDWRMLQAYRYQLNTGQFQVPTYWAMAQPLNCYSFIFLDDPNPLTQTNQRGERLLQTVLDSTNQSLYHKNTMLFRASAFAPTPNGAGYSNGNNWQLIPFILDPGHYAIRWTDYRFFRHPLRFLSGGPAGFGPGGASGYEDTLGDSGAAFVNGGPGGSNVNWSAWPWFPFRDTIVKIEAGANVPSYQYKLDAINVPVYKAVSWNPGNTSGGNLNVTRVGGLSAASLGTATINGVPNQNLYAHTWGGAGYPLFSWGALQPRRNPTGGTGGLEAYGTSNFRISLSGIFSNNAGITFLPPSSTIRPDHSFAAGTNNNFVNNAITTSTILPFTTAYSLRYYDANTNILSVNQSRGIQLDVTTVPLLPYYWGYSVTPILNNLNFTISLFGPWNTATTRYENYMCNIPISADIREIMLYNSALTDTEIENNISYLRFKWGI